MAITTIDQAASGARPLIAFSKAITPTQVAGRPASLWGLGGWPAAGAYNATLNGVVLDSTSALVNGQIPHYNPVSQNAHLHRFIASATQTGMLWLMDRLWHNGGFTITSTAAQSITSPTWPARDNAGSTNGDGVLLGLEVSAAAGAAAPTITISYTNQAGTAGRTATNIRTTENSPAAGAFYFIGLQAGDTGVRSVQSLTLSVSWVSGTINLVAFRPLLAIPIASAFVPSEVDFLTGGAPRIYDGAVPFMVFQPNTTTASNIQGMYQETWG